MPTRLSARTMARLLAKPQPPMPGSSANVLRSTELILPFKSPIRPSFAQRTSPSSAGCGLTVWTHRHSAGRRPAINTFSSNKTVAAAILKGSSSARPAYRAATPLTSLLHHPEECPLKLSARRKSLWAWYHVAAVRGPNYVQIFVNGQMQAQATVSFPQDYGILPLYFGTSGQTFWDHKFKGALDEVAFYNRPLTTNEIASIYTAGAAGKCKASTPPGIITQPQSVTVTAGSNAQFSVVAGGTVPLAYQWWFGNSTIPGATSPSLVISNAQPANGGNYSVVVTNTAGSVTSSVVALTVITPPSFTSPPQNTTNLAGSTAAFSATVIGSTPMTLQSRSTPRSGRQRSRHRLTNRRSLIANVQPSDAGNYTLVASNAAGTASAVATLVVNGPPFMNAQPSNQTAIAGAAAQFTVLAGGTQPLTYQWWFGGTPIAAATGGAIPLSNVQDATLAAIQS